ncbi:MAG: response regulator [Bacteroidetes bacterium]|nr:response regulator [Bacteroidota bacterium]
MKTILIVEDEMDIRANLQEMLENEGFNVLSAANGKEGLDISTSKEPDLILCDILMPQMDGYEMLKKLQENPNTAGTPFIFLTAKAEAQNFRKGMMLGADDYLMKPFRMDDVLDAINTRLRKKENCLSIVENFRDTLIKKVPHELRTPLVGILGFSEIIENDIEELTKEELKQMAKKIRYSGKRLHRRIEKFLVYAELFSLSKDNLFINSLSSQVYEVEPEYLASQLKNKIADFGREKDLKIHFEKGEIKIDVTHFETLLEELAENSAKFSSTGSSIEINGKANGQYFNTNVTDHGIGIKDVNKNLISPLNQFLKEETFIEGLGFGLAIAKLIIKLYGGYLKIASEEGAGTIVEFGIPLRNNN